MRVSGVFLVFASISLSAQYVPDSSSVPKVNLKLDATSLLNPNDPTVLFLGEYFYAPKVSSVLSGGWIFSLQDHFDSQVPNESFKGLKFGHELRIFFDSEEFGGRVYSGLKTQYRYLSIYDRYTLGFGCESGDCEYYQNFIGNIKTDRYSYELKLGFQTQPMERLLLEFDYGFGYHDFRVRRGSVNGGHLVDKSRFLSEENFATYPFMTFSVRLCYIFVSDKVSQ